MAAELYSNAAVYVRGALLVENTSVTIDSKTGAQPVLTMPLGFAGMSPGAPTTEISFDNAVRADGLEYDPTDDMKNMRVVPLQVFAGGKTFISSGFITEYSFKKAVNSEATISLKAMCNFGEWK
jgi:hypothetical protein